MQSANRTVMAIASAAIIGVVVIAAPVFAQSHPVAQSQKISFTMQDWQKANPPYWNAYNWVINSYEKLHPNVSITQKYVPLGASEMTSGYEEVLQTGYISGTAPALAEIQSSGATPLYNDGYLINLLPYLDSPTPYTHGATWGSTFNHGMETFQWEEENNDAGGVMFLPIDGDGGGAASWIGFYANLTILHKAGITRMPSNWNQFLADCAKIKAAGYNAIAAGNSGRFLQWLSEMFGSQMGQGYYEHFFPKQYAAPAIETAEQDAAVLDGKIGANNPLAVSMAKLMKQTAQYYEPGWEGTTMSEAKILWDTGKAAFRMTGAWNYSWYKANVDFKFSVLGWPTTEISKTESSFADDAWSAASPQTGAGWMVNAAIKKNPAELKAVIGFLQYATSLQVQKKFSEIANTEPEVSGVPLPKDLKPFAIPAKTATLTTDVGAFPLGIANELVPLNEEYFSGSLTLHQYLTTWVQDDREYLKTYLATNIFSTKSGLPATIKGAKATLQTAEKGHYAASVIATDKSTLAQDQLSLKFYDTYALPYMK